LSCRTAQLVVRPEASGAQAFDPEAFVLVASVLAVPDPEAFGLGATVLAAFDPEARVPLASALSAFVLGASSEPGLAEQVVQAPFSYTHL